MQHESQSPNIMVVSQDIRTEEVSPSFWQSINVSLSHRLLPVWAILQKYFYESILFIFFFMLVIGLVLFKTVLLTSAGAFSSFWTAYGFIISFFLLSRIPYAYLYEDNHDAVYQDGEYPGVSAIIASKDEEKCIYTTIAHVFGSEYPGAIECIVINDGSTDNTEQEILRAQSDFGERVRLISFKANRGKREAMAMGIQAARNELFVFIDSDSYVSPQGIRHIAEHFLADSRVGAVSGNTEVENANENLLTKMQSIQYAVSFGIYKACESIHKTVTCCPGCFSAYRRKAIEPLINEWKNQAFLGSKGNFGDDRALTNFVLRTWDVVYCERADATTVVPTKFRVYWKQQLRWKKSWIREGLFAALYMWKRHPFASIGFYIHFSFPFLGPILAFNVLAYSIVASNPLIFPLFMIGFIVIGLVFALFVRLYRNAENFLYMPIFSALFVSVLIWQMPYAIVTVRNNKWGTR